MSNTAADVITIEQHGDVAAIPLCPGAVVAMSRRTIPGGLGIGGASFSGFHVRGSAVPSRD